MEYILKGNVNILPRLNIAIEWRRKCPLWGRFGGGWNWKIGISIGGRTIIINVLLFTIRISMKLKKDD